MKRLLLSAAVVAATLSSCSKNEVGRSVADNKQAVTFGTYVSNVASKAQTENVGETKETFVEGDKFGVFAYFTDEANYPDNNTSYAPNFMFNQEVEKGSGDAAAWSYSPLKYWPNNVNSNNDKGQVSFFAYWPMAADDNNISLNNGTAAFGFATKADPTVKFDLVQDKNIDLMWAVESTSGLPFIDLTKQDASDKISFQFKHALAKVGFTVKLADDILLAAEQDEYTTVTIDKIEFGGSLTAGGIEGALTPNLTSSAVLNLNNTTANVANWTEVSGAEKTQLVLETEDFNDGEETIVCDKAVFTNKATSADAAIFTTKMQNDDDQYMMIIPQDFSTNKTAMRITYTVKTLDPAYDTADGAGDGYVTVVNKFVQEIAAKFECGKSYTYAFEIGLNTVKVEALDPTAWEVGTTDVPVMVDPQI